MKLQKEAVFESNYALNFKENGLNLYKSSLIVTNQNIEFKQNGKLQRQDLLINLIETQLSKENEEAQIDKSNENIIGQQEINEFNSQEKIVLEINQKQQIDTQITQEKSMQGINQKKECIDISSSSEIDNQLPNTKSNISWIQIRQSQTQKNFIHFLFTSLKQSESYKSGRLQKTNDNEPINKAQIMEYEEIQTQNSIQLSQFEGMIENESIEKEFLSVRGVKAYHIYKNGGYSSRSLKQLPPQLSSNTILATKRIKYFIPIDNQQFNFKIFHPKMIYNVSNRAEIPLYLPLGQRSPQDFSIQSTREVWGEKREGGICPRFSDKRGSYSPEPHGCESFINFHHHHHGTNYIHNIQYENCKHSAIRNTFYQYIFADVYQKDNIQPERAVKGEQPSSQ
ncbi:hypothetical protein ABPG72_012113 [Tetrahymena utriculariae]